MNIAFISMSEVKNIYFISGKTTNGEPQHDKYNKMSVQLAKTQIGVGIHSA